MPRLINMFFFSLFLFLFNVRGFSDRIHECECVYRRYAIHVVSSALEIGISTFQWFACVHAAYAVSSSVSSTHRTYSIPFFESFVQLYYFSLVLSLFYAVSFYTSIPLRFLGSHLFWLFTSNQIVIGVTTMLSSYSIVIQLPSLHRVHQIHVTFLLFFSGIHEMFLYLNIFLFSERKKNSSNSLIFRHIIISNCLLTKYSKIGKIPQSVTCTTCKCSSIQNNKKKRFKWTAYSDFLSVFISTSSSCNSILQLF